MSTTASQPAIPCPDPSAHIKPGHGSTTGSQSVNPLGPDGKLSSASAAASLTFAKARDLPGFPVVGTDRLASAGAAATLADANKSSFEHWKPEPSSHANKAALLAKDYKADPLWQPEMSAAGSKAALLAHRTGPSLNFWQPNASKDGNSAAHIAMRTTVPPNTDYGYTDTGRKYALAAAVQTVNANRQRAGSMPPPEKTPTAALDPKNLSMRTPSTHSAKRDAPPPSNHALSAARSQEISSKVNPQMYTEHPPVAIEVEEQRRNAALRGASMSFAKQMQDTIDKRHTVALDSPIVPAATSVSTDKEKLRQSAIQYLHLQDTAQKLAAERLAKLDRDDGTQYRAHYGMGAPQPARSRLSILGTRRARRASSGEVAGELNDEEQASRIRSQMRGFRSHIDQLDTKNRQKDRQSLHAAAEARVKARINDMDEKVFLETGKVSPAMMAQWEEKARARANADSEKRLAKEGKTKGKVHVGGGKYLDQSEIDAIAAARVQPTLDEINENAEKQRAKEEEERLDREEKRRSQMEEKRRTMEMKAESKRIRDEVKQAEQDRKKAEKEAKEANKEQEGSPGEKRLSRLPLFNSLRRKKDEDGGRKSNITVGPISKPTPIDPKTVLDDNHEAEEADDDSFVEVERGGPSEPPMEDRARESVEEAEVAEHAREPVEEVESAEEPEEEEEEEEAEHEEAEDASSPRTASSDEPHGRRRSFVEEAQEAAKRASIDMEKDKPSGMKKLLTKLKTRVTSHGDEDGERPENATEEAARTPASSTAVVSPRPPEENPLGQNPPSQTVLAVGAIPEPSDDELSSDGDEEKEKRIIEKEQREETKSKSAKDIAAKIAAKQRRRRGGDSDDDFEEARDTFDNEGLAPPAAAPSTGEVDSPARESHFREEF